MTAETSPGSLYIPPGTSAAEAAAMIAAAPMPPLKRKAARRVRSAPLPPPRPPQPRAVLLDGKPMMEVPLCGALGTGHVMVLDLLAWGRVVSLMGAEWSLRPSGAHGVSVVSYRLRATKLIGQRDGSAAFVVLARWLAGAEEGQVATFVNGNSLDLRRANLRLEDRGEHWNRHRVRLDSAETF